MSIRSTIRTRLLRPIRRKLTKIETTSPYLFFGQQEAPLSGQVAVVTGASGAIGRAIAARLAGSGADVYLLGRSQERLAAVAHELTGSGAKLFPVSLELTDDNEVRAFVEELRRVDILVNCAGGSARGAHAPLWEQTPDVVDSIIDSNLRAAIVVTAAVGRKMVAAERGRIVSIGSVLADGGKSHFADYAAAKGGLAAYMRTAAIELGPFGITVNLVSPGIVPRDTLDGDQVQRVKATNVLARVGKPEDVAEAVGFLVSDQAAFVTGVNLPVDGGRSLGLWGDS